MKHLIFSDKFDLNKHDFLKALLVLIITAATEVVIPRAMNMIWQFFSDGVLVANIPWVYIIKTSLLAGLSYLIKNYFQGQPRTITIDPAKTAVIKTTDTDF